MEWNCYEVSRFVCTSKWIQYSSQNTKPLTFEVIHSCKGADFIPFLNETQKSSRIKLIGTCHNKLRNYIGYEHIFINFIFYGILCCTSNLHTYIEISRLWRPELCFSLCLVICSISPFFLPWQSCDEGIYFMCECNMKGTNWCIKPQMILLNKITFIFIQFIMYKDYSGWWISVMSHLNNPVDLRSGLLSSYN